jgi:hypothetical protein
MKIRAPFDEDSVKGRFGGKKFPPRGMPGGGI